jgi:hypothetical protein
LWSQRPGRCVLGGPKIEKGPGTQVKQDSWGVRKRMQ